MPYNIQPLIDAIESILASHSLGRPGAYRRWNWDGGVSGSDRGLRTNPELNAYGCADAANLLYTIGCFPSDPVERASWIEVLQSMQDPASGLFHEATYHDIHCTAHCTAALEDFAAQYIPFLLNLDPATDEGLNDLHSLFGAACCLAELQAALPSQLRTTRPLRLVLDRRPFI